MQTIMEKKPCWVIEDGHLKQDGYVILVLREDANAGDDHVSIAFSDMSMEMQAELRKGVKGSIVPGGILENGPLVTPDNPVEFMDAIHSRNKRLRIAVGVSSDADGFAFLFESIAAGFIICVRFIKKILGYRRAQSSY